MKGEMHRILGLDYGAKRIGMSLSDPLQILATAYGALENGPAVWRRLAEIIEKEDVELVVVGMPTTLGGSKGKKAQDVQEFMTNLREHITVPVVEWDERFTTSIRLRPPSSACACTANTGRMRNSPSMRRPNTPARLSPARSSDAVMRSPGTADGIAGCSSG